MSHIEADCKNCIHNGLCKFEKSYREIIKDIIAKSENSMRYHNYTSFVIRVNCNHFKENLNRINYAPYGDGITVKKLESPEELKDLNISCEIKDEMHELAEEAPRFNREQEKYHNIYNGEEENE